MTIALTGGGSGGHITPLLVVADELKKTHPGVTLVYIGQTGDKLADIPAKHPSIDKVYTVRAGKFRRYHGEGFRQILDLPTLAKNIRDFFFVLIGLWQSYWLLRKIKPDALFVKGGYVVVPVGLAAAVRRIPYITHDSDALPGLANRIIARWARQHAVGLPKEIYKYPPQKTVTVGVPISQEFQPVTDALRTKYRNELGLEGYEQMIFVTGGGLGAQRLNESVAAAATNLLATYPKLVMVHVVGRDHEASVRGQYDKTLAAADAKRVIVKGFITDLYRYSGAADIIITRAGATNLAEFAAQHQACIIVPNAQLTGGHQLKNARVIAQQKAAVILEEKQLDKQPQMLGEAIRHLLDHPAERQTLGEQLGHIARPRATKELAELIVDMVS